MSATIANLVISFDAAGKSRRAVLQIEADCQMFRQLSIPADEAEAEHELHVCRDGLKALWLEASEDIVLEFGSQSIPIALGAPLVWTDALPGPSPLGGDLGTVLLHREKSGSEPATLDVLAAWDEPKKAPTKKSKRAAKAAE